MSAAMYFNICLPKIVFTSTDPGTGEMRDCKDHYDAGSTTNGVYTIRPDSLPAFDVSSTET